ncbi:MAG: COX15/CtaA family protein [Hyphomonadaceae bacterium]|nr:COX15/CtaA family protein [Hyphomonadaceae bacterium]
MSQQDALVGAWLATICALVTVMILVGGATRLTDSGLSITEWDFAKHFAPPLTERGWLDEFALYQRTTEYQVQNRGMSLDDFRFIYLWEWGHRFLGQVIGLVFVLPFLFFLATGRLKGRVAPIAALGVLGGLQGAVGWWMVTSGLYGRLDVSAVRLMTHLGLAFAILGFAFWQTMTAFGRPAARSAAGPGQGLVWALAAMLYAQILLGALMAGSDAGIAFNDWPTIGGEWMPSNYDEFSPPWANLTENRAAIQFHHRLVGYLYFGAAIGLAWLAFRAGGPAWPAAMATAGLALLQATLGIATILIGAPLWISLLHQAGAVALWLCTLWWARTARAR